MQKQKAIILPANFFPPLHFINPLGLRESRISIILCSNPQEFRVKAQSRRADDDPITAYHEKAPLWDEEGSTQKPIEPQRSEPSC